MAWQGPVIVVVGGPGAALEVVVGGYHEINLFRCHALFRMVVRPNCGLAWPPKNIGARAGAPPGTIVLEFLST